MTDPGAGHPSTPAENRARLVAEQGGTPFVLFRDPLGAQQIVMLDPSGGTRSIGRDPTADVSLAWDPRVSRLHATLEPGAGVWTVSDEGLSRNGTYVNAARITGRHRLDDGDVIRVGSTELLFQDPAGRETDETALTDVPTVDGGAPG